MGDFHTEHLTDSVYLINYEFIYSIIMCALP